ncbi:MAG: NrfD/PsrC family molybdoenzyme membrane anchor subunit, partial [Pyrinomonadaceae bacterium]
VLLLHFLASWLGSRSMQQWLMIAGVPLAILSAVYTAYLFAQAKARDMWQNPLLPPHLLVQAFLLGSATLLPFAAGYELSARLGSGIVTYLLSLLAGSTLLHVLMVWGEVSLTHATAHARLANWEMLQGRYKNDFWIGMGVSILGGLLPWLALLEYISTPLGIGGVPLALIGLILYENAYVQAGQSVPLA